LFSFTAQIFNELDVTHSKLTPATWHVLENVLERSQAYLNTLGDRPVAPPKQALDALKAFDVQLQDSPRSAEALIEELDRFGTPATVAIAGPRYFGFVNGGSLPGVLATNWLATAWEQHGAFQISSPPSTMLEKVALRWTLDVLGLPPDSGGGFVTGTTMAHVTALTAARQALLETVGWNADANGLFGAPPVTVVVGDEVHTTLLKALGMIGFGRSRIVRVPVDDQGRIRVAAMPRLSGPTIVCVQAGHVNTGAFDPFVEIIDRVRRSAAPTWVHIDGAFGLWARVAPDRAYLTKGMELADSWATDAHKWLNTPYDCGIAIVRDAELLRKCMSINAAYLPTDPANPCDFTPEASRRPRGVDVWAALRVLGRSGLADLVERTCRLAKRFADAFVKAGLTVHNDVVLNQVLVSFGDADRTRRVIAGVQEDGTCWCGPTVWQGKTAMRVSVINWSTTEDDVDRSVAAILRIANSVS
jgi:glutamate/tyrosine decarboxylase-like PLP-dependent enzyme